MADRKLKHGYELIGTNDYVFDLIGTLFENRGIQIDREEFLSPSNSHLLTPFSLANLETAKSVLLKTLLENKSVHMLSDEDADGYASNSSLFLLVEFLKHKLESKSKVTWSVHEKKTHGIKIDELKPYNFDLLLMADGGSNDYSEHRYYSNKNVSIVILDHHKVDSPQSTEIVTIVNPMLDNYPNKELSGAGVVYKFIQSFSEYDGISKVLDDCSTLLSVGMVADMMSLKNLETRYIVKHGISEIKHPLISELLKLKNIKDCKISDISFYIAPYINAMTRIGNKTQKSKMFEALINPNKPIISVHGFSTKKTNGFENKYLYQEVLQDLINIKEEQEKQQIELVEYLTPQLNDFNKINICISDRPSLIKGMVANNIASETMKPTLVVEIKENGECFGSGRGFYTVTDNFRKDILDSGLFIFAEGHDNAFGVGFLLENKGLIQEYFNDRYKSSAYKYPVDFLIKSNNLTSTICEQVEKLKFDFGSGFEEPIIYLENLKLENVWTNSPKFTVLKFSFKEEYEVVLFNPSEDDLESLREGVTASFIGRIGINEFRGKKTGQFIVDKYKIELSDVVSNLEDSPTQKENKSFWW